MDKKDEYNLLIYDLNKENKETITIDYRNSNYKNISIPFEEINCNIIIKQDYRIGKGGIFWDGSFFITKYLLNNILNKIFINKIPNILELGAGTGVPSIASLIRGSNTIITDLPNYIPFLKEIIELNKNNFNIKSNFNILPLDWSKENDIENVKKINNKPFDIIIASELIYLDDLFDDLINVLKTFSDKNTYIILSYKIRLPEMVEDFINKLKIYFTIEYIDYNLKNILYPKPEKLQLIRIIKIN
jgi:predicted nicotinamide N-methyase